MNTTLKNKNNSSPRLRLPLLLSMLSIACSLPAAAEMPVGEPKDWPAAPEDHVVTVRREAADEKQSAMIAAAEAAQVPADVLRRAAAEDPFRYPLEPQPADVQRRAAGEPEIPVGEKVWWYKESLGIRIPCGITADAVTYYSDLVGKYSKQALNRHNRPHSRFDYHATVAFHKQFEHEGKTLKDVHVVTMKLTFSQYFVATHGQGMRFSKERVVILDAAGKVLHISGDGPTECEIWDS